MADAVASPLLLTLNKRLCSVTSVLEFKQFKLTVAETLTLVVEAENRMEEDEAFRSWIIEVKDIAYEANDVLDDVWNISESFSKLPLFFFNLYFCFTFARKMKYLEGRLNALLQRREKFQIQKAAHAQLLPLPSDQSSSSAENGTPTNTTKVSTRIETTSFVPESKVVGRERDVEYLVRQLIGECKPEPESGLNVVGIVGMGGLGKTTLAQLVYNDRRVCSWFEGAYWVCVGQDFDVKMIGKAIVESKIASVMHSRQLTMDPVLGVVDAFIREELEGRRFLMVLDDVWSENQEKWSVLQRWFSVGAPGSAVVVTTRNEGVAVLISSSVQVYRLKPLSDEDAWLLFKSEAFSSAFDGNSSSNNRFVQTGRKLVTKCEGLPLAVRAVAGLMRYKREESEWIQLMQKDDFWLQRGLASSVLWAPRLSYNHLPPHLKQCFAYCAIFPTNYTISRENLIQLWIAQGFVHSSTDQYLEDVGNSYFMELVGRSLFRDIQRDDYGEVVSCRMHDIIHELARTVARTSCSNIVLGGTHKNLPEEVRHASLVSDSDEQLAKTAKLLQKAKKLRTWLWLSDRNHKSVPASLFKLRCLRTLDLSGSRLQKLPKAVGKLKHLRFLNLSHTLIKTLPQSIRKLRNLYTLQLVECYHLQELPRSICGLTNLRNLDIESCLSLSRMPPQIGKLRLLQKLPMFILNKDDGCGKISELKKLDLRGKLEIKNLECLGSTAEASEAGLFKKMNLRHLELSWSSPDSEMNSQVSYEVLEHLEPPQDLTALHIVGYKNLKYPVWMRILFYPSLVSFSLTNCSCKTLPPLGKLPNLKYLCIKGMSEVEKIDHSFYGGEGTIEAFPSLIEFELSEMLKLEEWLSFPNPNPNPNQSSFSSSSPLWSYSSEEAAFPCLELLTISGCRELRAIPALLKLKKLALWYCHEELFQSLHSLTSLRSLVVGEFPDSFYLPPGSLSYVRNLTIYDCGNLLAAILDDGMESSSSLEQLSILFCSRLKSLPTSLTRLTSLKNLDIGGCQDLQYLPETMDRLISLEEMVIDSCPMLDSLPKTIPSLTKLKKLVIRDCHKLLKRLKANEGQEWSKIAHILSIDADIDGHVDKGDLEGKNYP